MAEVVRINRGAGPSFVPTSDQRVMVERFAALLVVGGGDRAGPGCPAGDCAEHAAKVFQGRVAPWSRDRGPAAEAGAAAGGGTRLRSGAGVSAGAGVA